MNAVVPLHIQRALVTIHCAAGLDQITLDGQRMAVQINGICRCHRYPIVDGQIVQQGINDKISLPIELRIAADDQLIEMAAAVFKGHRASTAAIQHNLMGAAGDEILTAAAVAVKLGKIALDGQRTSRKIIAVVSGIIRIGGLHDEVAGYIDFVHLFDHFQIATRITICKFAIVIR